MRGLYHLPDNDFDMRPQVTKLKGMDFDGVAFGGFYYDAITFMKELRRQGMKQPLVGGSPFMNEYFPTGEEPMPKGPVPPALSIILLRPGSSSRNS